MFPLRLQNQTLLDTVGTSHLDQEVTFEMEEAVN